QGNDGNDDRNGPHTPTPHAFVHRIQGIMLQRSAMCKLFTRVVAHATNDRREILVASAPRPNLQGCFPLPAVTQFFFAAGLSCFTT
ncbi:MAG: hypothetical protein MI923_05115, partial [Phycisphaerales bacterium]|nr:hypothetical protein [Phycisphaerales bacterium]